MSNDVMSKSSTAAQYPPLMRNQMLAPRDTSYIFPGENDLLFSKAQRICLLANLQLVLSKHMCLPMALLHSMARAFKLMATSQTTTTNTTANHYHHLLWKNSDFWYTCCAHREHISRTHSNQIKSHKISSYFSLLQTLYIFEGTPSAFICKTTKRQKTEE